MKLDLPMDNELLNEAKALINRYIAKEFGKENEDTFEDLRKIAIGFTTITDDEIPTQIYANLVDNSIERYLGQHLIEKRRYSSLRELIDYELSDLSFDNLISYYDTEIERYYALEEAIKDSVPYKSESEIQPG